LSELEDMLSEEDGEEVVDESLEDLDLELELDPDLDKAVESVEQEADVEEPGELDLTDIEKALDADDLEIEVEDELEEVELELATEAPELEIAAKDADGIVISDELEDIDLTDIEKMLEVEDDVEADQEEIGLEGLDGIDELIDTTDIEELDETGDIELVLDDHEKERIVEDEVESEEELEEKELEDTDPFYAETQIIDRTTEELIEPVAEAEEETERKATPVVKKGVSKPVLVLLILLLLGGAGIGTVFLLNYLNIEIPFVGDYLKPKVSDPSGNLKMGTLDIKDKFVENLTSGRLLVITGQVENEYSNVRSFIRVTGRLLTTNKKIASTATVFCGNIIIDSELKNQNIATIKQKLANRTGDNNSNTQVQPGQQIPFMIVFANLPENLDVYEIEVSGSSAKQ